MQELIITIVKGLVDDKDAVSVTVNCNYRRRTE